MRRLAWVLAITACGSAVPRAVVSAPAPASTEPPAAVEALASIASDSCGGYSPSERVWVCGREETGGGMVAWPGRRSWVQLLRGVSVLAEVSVVAETGSLSEAGDVQLLDQVLPLAVAQRIYPTDLVRPTHLKLRPGENELPGSPHRVRWDQPRDRSGHSKLSVMCRPSRPEARFGSYRYGVGSPRVGGVPPAPVVVFIAAAACDRHDEFGLAVAPDHRQIALIEDASFGCVDFFVHFRRAHPLDLAAICGTDQEPRTAAPVDRRAG